MRRSVAIAMSLALAGAVACKRKGREDGAETKVVVAEDAAKAVTGPEQLLIDELSITVGDSSPPTDLYRDQLAQYLGRQLAGSGYFFALANETDPMQPSRRARIAAQVSYERVSMGPAGQPAVLAAVELTATWTDASEPFLRENVMGERVLEPGEEAELPQLIVGLVAKTVEEAGTGLIAQEKLRVSKDEEVLAWLGEPEDGRSPSLLTFALRRVGERKPAGAIEVVARHLGSSHSTVRDEAMATLVALGDPAAVDPLTRAAAFDDPQAMVAVIEAVSVLGGQDALDYLDLVATGHPEDDIKSRAIEALERLRARNAPAHMP